ncbi:MAG: helix-turn-helix domain-containing protein [Micromonosporaceae bacterium]|nr:helix-turn-helix domain-containing protein [Micromonosporaceae bacterium]
MSEPDTQPATGIARRVLRDPRALRAMAHPVRLRIMEELARAGQATATELSEWIGESAANCSWHLRQLAQYGFIEEAGGGTGRQRPWKVVVQSNTFGWPEAAESELAYASDAVTEVVLERELAAYRAWRATRHEEPDAWRDVSFLAQSWDWFTAEELAAFKADFDALIERHLSRERAARADPANRPPGARMVRLVTWVIPD